MSIWWALQIISMLLVSLKVCTTSTKNKKPAPCGDKPQPSISSGSDQSRSHRCVAPPVYSWQCISDLSSVRRETTHHERKISCYLSLQIMISNRTPLCSSTRHWYCHISADIRHKTRSPVICLLSWLPLINMILYGYRTFNRKVSAL